MTQQINIRREQPEDYPAVFEINNLAFDTDAEAILVDKLRAAGIPLISLAAECDNRLTGHILFSPVTINNVIAGVNTMGLAPMAVHPEYQNKGIGSKLVYAGLEECRKAGAELIFVLGHPNYYPRFGFEPVLDFGLHYADPEYDPYFFVTELKPGVLEKAKGTVAYNQLFEGV